MINRKQKSKTLRIKKSNMEYITIHGTKTTMYDHGSGQEKNNTIN